MHAAALNLFLVESAAISLKNDDELGGGLASSLQKRHKIRDSDLEKLFNLIDPLPAGAWTKVYLVFNLLHYAGAAYADAWPLISAKPKALGDALVKPHWDPTSVYSLGKVYDWEPMNLFPGWSLTNVRNNHHVFDPHVLFWENGVASNDLHGVLHSKSSNDTEGMRMANALHPNDFAITQDRLGGSGLPNRERRYSHYTGYYQANQSKELGTLAKLQKNKTHAINQQKALEKFNTLLSRFRASTLAGKEHYTSMQGSLQRQGLTAQNELVQQLQAAQNNWTLHRQNNIATLEDAINQIRQKDPTTFSMDIATNKDVMSD